jgi:hypothetical protein
MMIVWEDAEDGRIDERERDEILKDLPHPDDPPVTRNTDNKAGEGDRAQMQSNEAEEDDEDEEEEQEEEESEEEEEELSDGEDTVLDEEEFIIDGEQAGSGEAGQYGGSETAPNEEEVLSEREQQPHAA